MGWDVNELYERDKEKFIDYENLTIESQQALNLFNVLPDKLDGAAIGWYGKDFSELSFFMELLEIYDYKKVFNLLLLIVSEYSKHVSKEREKAENRR